ncbi:MAG: selenide, water dikinase SelD [Bacteroidales bacterium]
MNKIKLTQYSHGAGCGCKISPSVLSTILESSRGVFSDSRLLVGNESRDDAAVYDLDNGEALISTTDFFMPIVDDAFTFGQIAATNAISDVYAMGGRPVLAIAILGWPVDKISAEVANLVIEGGRETCRKAGIALAGGHSIDSPEPIFGLAVNGLVSIANLKKNNTAKTGSSLYLTKPLGVGILSTAQKRGVVAEVDVANMIDSMTLLNTIGEELGKLACVNSMTDVTGFSLMGHLHEMCEGSGLSAEIFYDALPILPNIDKYISQGCIPGGCNRNMQTYSKHIQLSNPDFASLLYDPQTSGGLLVSVDKGYEAEVEKLLDANNLYSRKIGTLTEQIDICIRVS